MNITRICIKAIAVLTGIGIAVSAYGCCALSAFAENDPRKNRILVKGITEGDIAKREAGNMVFGKSIKGKYAGKYKEMPFLVKGIKYNCIESESRLVFYISNQKMVYSTPAEICIYFSYSCQIGEKRLTLEMCEESARKGIYSAFSGMRGIRITECILSEYDEKICSFTVRTNYTKDAEVKISVRRDTGSIILFDALDSETTVLALCTEKGWHY